MDTTWENMTEEERKIAKKIMEMSKGSSVEENKSFAVVSSKAEKFKKISTRRLQKTLNELDKIANLTKTSRYAYTEQQAKKLVDEIEERLATIKVLFERNLELQRKKSQKSVATPHTRPNDEV